MAGRLVILSGPSGVGKDTVLNAWHQEDPRVIRVVAYTTRPPRRGEVPGVDYNFISKPEFEAKGEAGDFLEQKEVFGNYYATPLRDMEVLLNEGKIAVLKIDVQGAMTVMEKRPDAVTIMLLPPSFEELAHRIRSRQTDSPEQIERRLRIAREEMALAPRYQHQVVNGDVDEAVQELRRLLAN